MDEDIEVVFHHGGKLVNDGKLKYEGGETSRFMFDPDVWSYFVVVSVVKSLGYHGFKDMWYSVGGASVLDDKLESLCNDTDAMHMMGEQVEVDAVMEEEVVRVEQVGGVLEEMGDVDGEEQEMGEQVEVDVVMEEEVVKVEQVGGVLEEMGDVDGEEQEMGEQVEVEAVMEEEVDGVEQVQEVGGDGEHEGEEENEVEADVEIRSWNSSFENGSGDGNTEWLEGLVDVNVGCDIDDDIHADLEGNVEVEVQSMSNDSSGPCSNVSSDSMFDVNVEGGNDKGLSDDEWKSEQLISGAESDEDDTDCLNEKVQTSQFVFCNGEAINHINVANYYP
ncbi:uncharacterized protein HKW66_Vig0154300 [Vigna angularis]|uniref:PB1-like domain-containing protein n=1 Tax=Phaseolus angularis TaxID=3914 RepID=A0A8T0JLT7_PHAAN|nr:uncharacterized protein HKW66_Vig0154300 [Vigna angularis]